MCTVLVGGTVGARPAAAVANVITVTSDADAGDGSLRDAIAEAATTPGEDRIVFAIPGTGPFVIRLTSPLAIWSPLVVDGTTQPGWDGEPVVTLDGGDETRLLDVTASPVRLVGLRFANGPRTRPDHDRDHAAVLVDGTVEVARSEFVSNEGGGLEASSGGVTVEASRFTGNGRSALVVEGATVTVVGSEFRGNGRAATGAAIASTGRLVVVDSTFTGNRAEYGGAVYAAGSFGTTRIVGSTFAGNTANQGGAIWSASDLTIERTTLAGNLTVYDDLGVGAGHGGALVNAGTARITDSTFAGNRADGDGGAIANRSALRLVHVTVAGNVAGGLGGAVHTSGYRVASRLHNTLVDRNSYPACGGRAVDDGGGNLTWADTTCPGIRADPTLGPLQDNGGPTWTMLPQFDSPAVGAAEADVCTPTDQRGAARPSGPFCDIGAVERQPDDPPWS